METFFCNFSVSVLLGAIVLSNLVSSHQEDDRSSWKSTIVTLYFVMSIEMPIMIGLTLRAAKKKKLLPQIPMKPMFHENDRNDKKMSGSMMILPQITQSEGTKNQPTRDIIKRRNSI